MKTDFGTRELNIGKKINAFGFRVSNYTLSGDNVFEWEDKTQE